MPHTPFRRRSRPLGQTYAPSEVSGILSFNNIQMKGKTTFFLLVYGFRVKYPGRPLAGSSIRSPSRLTRSGFPQ